MTQIKSLDITTLDRLNLRNAKPVGILAGRELQNGFGVDGSTTTSISSSTEIEFKDHIYSTISIRHQNIYTMAYQMILESIVPKESIF